jgi:uncharacterized protein (DUF1499 family)
LPAKGIAGLQTNRGQARSCETVHVDFGAPGIVAARLAAVLLACILSFMSPILLAGATPRTLAPCPESPNCVSSESADRAHFTEPLRYTGEAARAWQRLQSVLAAEPRITIIEDTGSYLHAEARSLVFRFVDDVEFLLDSAHGVIHVRSASRVGYGDFGVNRRRVERIRKAFHTQP